MARKTRAEREAEEAANRAAWLKEQADEVRSNWQARIVMVLLRATREPVEVVQETVDGVTWVTLRDTRPHLDRFWNEPRFPVELPEDDRSVVHVADELESAERMFNEMDQERREADRRAKLKSEALAKLSAEEREVLGL